MNLSEYKEQSARTMSPNYFPMSISAETIHGIVGVVTEAGELMDALKEAIFYDLKFDRENVREEIGDVMWYIMAIVRPEGWDLENIPYEEQSVRSMSPNYFPMSISTETIRGIMGIVTEAGELMDALKKTMFYGRDIDRDNVRKRINNIMQYIMVIMRSEGWDLEDIMQENIDKLKIRYPEQFTTELSIKRLDKK